MIWTLFALAIFTILFCIVVLKYSDRWSVLMQSLAQALIMILMAASAMLGAYTIMLL